MSKSITDSIYMLVTTDYTTMPDAPVGSELIMLDGATGKATSFWIMTPVDNPITSNRWWQL